MKITIVLGAFLPVPPIMGGAIEKVWFALAQEFARRGHEVVQISRAVPKFPHEEVLNGVKHRRVRGFDTPRSLVWLKILDLVYSRRVMSILPEADIVVPHTFWLPLLLRNAKRGRVYVHIGRYPKGQMRFYRHVARFQAPTRALARAVADEAPEVEPKISVVPNPRPQFITDQLPIPSEQREKIIIFVGRVHPEKGVHLLVEAFAGRERAPFAGWKLIIIGPIETKLGGGGAQYLAELERIARGNSDVIFRGSIFDAPELEKAYRAARLFVYPSLAERGESFGLAPLEAMAHGSAVIVSDLGCFHDFIGDGDTGFIFNHRAPDPTQALREKLENVIVDPTLLSRVAEAGYRHSENYSLARVADQFLADFDSVIRNSDA